MSVCLSVVDRQLQSMCQALSVLTIVVTFDDDLEHSKLYVLSSRTGR